MLKPNARHSRSRRPAMGILQLVRQSAERECGATYATPCPILLVLPSSTLSMLTAPACTVQAASAPDDAASTATFYPRDSSSAACRLMARIPDATRLPIGTWPIEMAQCAQVQQASATVCWTRRRNAVITTTQAAVAHAVWTRQSVTCPYTTLLYTTPTSVDLGSKHPALAEKYWGSRSACIVKRRQHSRRLSLVKG